MNYTPKGDNTGGAGCDDPHVRICERPMQLRMGILYHAMVRLKGIEPPHMVPETIALSTDLQACDVVR